MAREFAASLIEGINRLTARLEQSADNLAEELLDKTYYEVPRPAWNTGDLRSSGAVYVGSRLVKRTPWTGANPVGGYTAMGSSGISENTGGFAAKTMRASKLQKGTRGSDYVSTVRDKITVIYDSPVAALMHEWPGGFSHPESGPLYIAAKFITFDKNFYQVMKEVFR